LYTFFVAVPISCSIKESLLVILISALICALVEIRFMLSVVGIGRNSQEVGLDNQQDFINFFNVLDTFPMPEPASETESVDSYIVTHIKNLKPNGKCVLSTSSTPGLFELTSRSKPWGGEHE
jgi:hypothetical protein